MVMETYCHGLLASGTLRRALLEKIGARSNARDHAEYVDAALNAEHQGCHTWPVRPPREDRA